MNLRCCGVKTGQSFAFGVWRLNNFHFDAAHRLSPLHINPRHFPQLRPGVKKTHSLHEPEPPLECTPEQLHLAS
jgi:hypothetical protein